MFAIAIYDRRRDELYLIRDRIGVKPLYVTQSGAGILFASEIKALLAAGVRKDLYPPAVDLFLSYNYVPPPFTMYEGIRHVMPGHYLRITRATTHEHCWWQLAEVRPVGGRPQQQWIDEFNSLLNDAVRLRLRADVPFGAFLSGGVDSSTIVGLMARHSSLPVRTFCIGFHDPRYDESPFAQQAADRFGAQHTMERVSPNMLDLWPKVLYHCDQPHGDVSFMPTYRLAELAARHVKVVLTGDGGDELFAGYEKYRDFFRNQPVADLPDAAFQERYLQSISLLGDRAKAQLYQPTFRARLDGSSALDLARGHFVKARHFDRVNQALYLDMQLLLPGNNLVKPDRMGMAVSLEARTPFLDYRVAEHGFRMPGELKLRDGEMKYIYKRAVTGLIGRDLAYRKKQMFTVPIGEWLKDELRPYCERLLSNRNGLFETIFQSAALLDLLEEHVRGECNRTRELRGLMAISIWTDIFVGASDFRWNDQGVHVRGN